MRRGRWFVLAPPFAWLGAFFLAPLILLLKISLSQTAIAQPPYRPTLDPMAGAEAWRTFLAGLSGDNYAALLSDDLYLRAATSSLVIAGISTAILVLSGYPIALALARASSRWRPLLVGLVILPFWTSFLIRVYAWIAILKPDGWLDALLTSMVLAREPTGLLDTNAAVVIGIVYAYLPFMVLPVMAVLDRADPALLEAAADLGAGPRRAFWTVTFPLSLPGLAAGATLCFVPIVGEFVIPDLLGGSSTLMLGRTLWLEFFANRDWPLASAVAIVLLAILLAPILAYRRLEESRLAARR